MRPRNVGVAHVRACRNNWNHTHVHARAAQETQGQNAASNVSGYQHTWPLHSKNNPEPHEHRDGPDAVWVLISHGADSSKEHHAPDVLSVVSVFASAFVEPPCPLRGCASKYDGQELPTRCSTMRYYLHSCGMIFPTVSSITCSKEMFNIIGGTSPTIWSSKRSRMLWKLLETLQWYLATSKPVITFRSNSLLE